MEETTATTLPIEETPEIPMTVPPAPPQKKTSFFSTLGLIILFVALFGVGIWLSSVLKTYLPNGIPLSPALVPQVTKVASPTPTLRDPMASWQRFSVTDGVTIQLPPDVLLPICDTAACFSQGTYLPGGTRFTVAARGEGQALLDSRQGVITDVNGTVFTTKEASVAGYTAKEFSGTFTGKTIAGYGFSQMHGYMVELSPTTSLELNHFTPLGIVTDFSADDTLFTKIVETLVFADTVPVATATPKTATVSGN